eukprot:CAMPEP_0202348820 /NCGR_PEP_ID=MMETSP1126-20121109/6574_1 /ASSEMBLY_ACC=CAM_ASM_000457 /TAXON_ID=3047 /ORGANISM="Dunaliella tertiolecta, Strain CCMP1320" /LENGTH=205 /DNA_ID=CAMNT_0048940537 /DNA_START=528 /DNA_END=1142 /DNA_ORIENTATION=+
MVSPQSARAFTKNCSFNLKNTDPDVLRAGHFPLCSPACVRSVGTKPENLLQCCMSVSMEAPHFPPVKKVWCLLSMMSASKNVMIGSGRCGTFWAVITPQAYPWAKLNSCICKETCQSSAAPAAGDLELENLWYPWKTWPCESQLHGGGPCKLEQSSPSPVGAGMGGMSVSLLRPPSSESGSVRSKGKSCGWIGQGSSSSMAVVAW